MQDQVTWNPSLLSTRRAHLGSRPSSSPPSSPAPHHRQLELEHLLSSSSACVMSSLDKLAIRGIRSFDNNKLAVVEFQSPVTVIVGSNGTGKTTIIECLKYATTGELPPNTKGGAFVHDPKIAGEKEVKAQVKLRFRNSNHERMVVTRNLSVTVKKTGGLTMKTLEGILSKDEANDSNTKRNTISTKCSEIDSEVPRLLGVSEAILDNVIFCHQEESNWPLSEPGPLKKKFDEIFEATKFTDALDSIKKIRKDRTADLKVEKERLNHLKLEKDRSETIKTKIAKLDQSISAKQASADDIGQRAQELAEVNLDFREKAGQFSDLFNKQEQLKHQITVWEEQIAGYEESMTLLKDSEEELRNQIRSFDRELERKKSERVEKQNRKTDQEEVLRALERDRSSLVHRRGQLIGEKTSHENAIKNREETAKVICRNYDFKGYDYSPLEKAKVDEIVDKLRDVHRTQEALVKRMKEDAKAREEKYQTDVTTLRTAKATEVGSRSSLQRQIEDISRSIRTDQSETQNQVASSLESDLHIGRQQLDKESATLAELESTIVEAKYDEKKKQVRLEIGQKEGEREGLNAEFASLNQYSEVRATLNVKREGLARNETYVRTHLEKTNDSHRNLVGKDAVAATMERDVGNVLIEKEIEIGRAERDKAAVDRKLSQIETTITQDLDKIKEGERELRSLEAEVRSACEDAESSDVASALKVCAEEIDADQEEIQALETLPAFMEKVIQTMKKYDRCIGCDRGIATTERAAIEKYANSKIQSSRSRSKIDEVRSHLAAYEAKRTELFRLQPKEEKAKKLRREDIPELKQRAESKQGELEKAKKESEKAAATVDALKAEQRDLVQLKNLAASIAKADKDCNELRQDIKDLEANLASTDSNRTAKQVEEELAQLASDIKVLNQRLTNLNQEQDSNNRQAQTIRNSIHNRTMENSRKTAQLQKYKVVEERLAESRNKQVDLKEQLKALDEKIAAADQPIRKLQDEMVAWRNEHNSEIFLAEAALGSHVESIQGLERTTQAVEAWPTSRGPARLRQLEDDMSKKEAELKETRDAIASYDAAVRQAENDIHLSDKNKKNIQDNIRHRSFKSQIEHARKEMGELNIEEAAHAREQYKEKYGKSKQREADLNAQHATLIGEMSSLRAQALELKETLSSEYKNIKQDFMSKLIEVKTSDLALVDLEKYSKALDNAIMRYHSVKMAEINDNLKHLWNKTYQGTDIDGIIIRSDSDEPVKATTSTTRKSYNYRVVMVKDQVEMDMRGRCSAGQKVLASIIIRLALSDSFGHNCGIIALDEPTTNLDRDNIKSLATSLAAIIQERKNSGNFQLVVITHDESFLKELSMADGLDYFMRVSRDNNQKSIVTRHRISHLN